MIKQGFHIGNNDWWVMVYYNVTPSEKDMSQVCEVLLACGCPRYKVNEALRILSTLNTGLTYTNYNERNSVVFISEASSPDQFYDSVQHELKHIVEHIGYYYDVNSRSEESAYLQGEVARQMYPAAAMILCPKCGEHHAMQMKKGGC